MGWRFRKAFRVRGGSARPRALVTAKLHLAAWTVVALMLCPRWFAVAAESAMPNRLLTPGATLSVSANDICFRGYSRLVRNVPSPFRREIYNEYHVENLPGKHELEHLIPLELGGSNDRRNLWPEPYHITWNAHVKDVLERKLHTRVCARKLSLREAQRAIATDWIAAYRHFVGHPPTTKYQTQ